MHINATSFCQPCPLSVHLCSYNRVNTYF